MTNNIHQPITEVTSNDIVCNGGPNPTKATSKVITVQAGSSAKLTWRHTLTSGGGDVIDASHKGPVMAYMKKVSDATKDSGVGGTTHLLSYLSSFQFSLPFQILQCNGARFRHDIGIIAD